MPAPQVTSETWDELWTLTRRAHRKRLTDTIFEEYPILNWFRRMAMETEKGGKEIQENIVYAKQLGAWFSPRDKLQTAAVDTITSVFYPWRNFQVPISIDFQEEDMNRMSAEGAIKLLSHRTENAMMSMRDAISAVLMGSSSGLTMLGLQDIVADNPATGSLGGLSRGENDFWRNKYNSSAVNFDAEVDNVFTGLKELNRVYTESSSGNIVPSALFMTETLFNQYQDILNSTAYARTTLAEGKKAYSKGNPMFKGTEVMFDRDMPANHIYGINKTYTKLKVMAGRNMMKTKFKAPYDQMVQVAQLIFVGQLITTNPRRSFVMSNVT